MYVTGNGHAKAFPENVTRLNLIYSPKKELEIAFNYLYYYRWYSSGGNESNSNHMVNVGLEYDLTQDVVLYSSIANLLDSDELYPMNNNPGSDTVADGTPSLEGRFFWLGLEYSF